MKKHWVLLAILMIASILVGGCGLSKGSPFSNKMKVGVMLVESGLGDQAFSDLAFQGLVKARDELAILFDYRELTNESTYEQELTGLIEENNDLIIAIGEQVKNDLQKVAIEHPEQKFLLIDALLELDNVTSILFKENEGSYMAGVAAALTTKTKKVGFIGGENVPALQSIAKGFSDGVHSFDPEIEIITEYAGTFNDERIGSRIARDMITENIDVLYAVAGTTGIGVLTEAERFNVFAIGNNSDQYFHAEQAVITSMVKNIDLALFNIIENYIETKELPGKVIELGLKENGVGLAPFRGVRFSVNDYKTLTDSESEFTK